MTTFNQIDLEAIRMKALKKKQLTLNRYKMEPEYGYMVTLKGNHTKAKYPTTIRIASYMAKLNVSRDKYIQVWFDPSGEDPIWHFDIAINLQNIESAKLLAKRNNQSFIWDVVNKMEVRV